MTDVGHVLARLGATSRADLTVRTGQGSGGSGTGTATVTCEGDALVVTEVGSWAYAGGSPMRWRAVSRWRADGDALAVEHLRQGEPAVAVLDRRPDGTWLGREAHLCGPDRYEAALDVGPEALTVTWTVSGPCKAARITTRYA